MDPGYHSIQHVAGLDSFVTTVADGVERKECPMTEPYTVVMKYGVEFAFLLPTV